MIAAKKAEAGGDIDGCPIEGDDDGKDKDWVGLG
jgi:hypothetical protein